MTIGGVGLTRTNQLLIIQQGNCGDDFAGPGYTPCEDGVDAFYGGLLGVELADGATYCTAIGAKAAEEIAVDCAEPYVNNFCPSVCGICGAGDTGVGAWAAVWDGTTNPTKVSPGAESNFYAFGRPIKGIAGKHYKLCWAHDPDWSRSARLLTLL